MAPTNTSFVRTCMDFFSDNGAGRRVTADEFKALSTADRKDLHAGFIAAGMNCDPPHGT